MSWADSEHLEHDLDEAPQEWGDQQSNTTWRIEPQEDVDNVSQMEQSQEVPEIDISINKNEDDNEDTPQLVINTSEKKLKKGDSKKKLLSKVISRHFNLQSTEPLPIKDAKWICIKSLLLWLYLLAMSSGFINNQSPQTIWIISYFILLLVWCAFFRATASSSKGGFYPFLGDWKSQILHTLLFIIGLAGVDLYFLQSKQSLMKECVMQYKVVEFSVLWFFYFISAAWKVYPWSQTIDEEYNEWILNYNSLNIWQIFNSLPILLLLLDSIVHYSYVYHHQFWTHHSNMIVVYAKYVFVLFILVMDVIVRSFLIVLFDGLSPFIIVLMFGAYVTYVALIWISALKVSWDAPAKQFKLIFKKSGGKISQAILLSFWSVCGIFQLIPSIKSSSIDVQQQQRTQQKWGKNVIRSECFIRLFLSVILFTHYWIMNTSVVSNNTKYNDSESIMIYIVMIIFAFYPYAMEFLFQTPIALLNRGSFFLIQHIDSLTSLPNIYRFQKDLHIIGNDSINSWKYGLIITRIFEFKKLINNYGRKCSNRTIIRFLQRILFEIEDNSTARLKLYRFENDRFGIICNFTDKSELKTFVECLANIEIIVLRPPDFSIADQKEIMKQEKENENDENEDVDDVKDEDFINPGNAASGGYGGGNDYGNDNADGGGNWFDDNEEDGNDDDADDDGSNDRNRKVSLFNKNTANESMTMSLRVCASFGPLCTLEHVIGIEIEMKASEKSGEHVGKYMIDQLDDKNY